MLEFRLTKTVIIGVFTLLLLGLSSTSYAEEKTVTNFDEFIKIIEASSDFEQSAETIAEKINEEKNISRHLFKTYQAMSIVKSGKLAGEFRSIIGEKVWPKYENFCVQPDLACNQLIVSLSEFRMYPHFQLIKLYSKLMGNIRGWESRYQSKYFIDLISLQLKILEWVKMLHPHAHVGGALEYKENSNPKSVVKQIKSFTASLWKRTRREKNFQSFRSFSGFNESESREEVSAAIFIIENTDILIDAFSVVMYSERLSLETEDWVQKFKDSSGVKLYFSDLPKAVVYARSLRNFRNLEYVRSSRSLWFDEVLEAFDEDSTVVGESLTQIAKIEAEIASFLPKHLDLDVLLDKEEEFIKKEGDRLGLHSLYHAAKSLNSSFKHMQMAAEIYEEDEADESFSEYEWGFYAVETINLKLQCMELYGTEDKPAYIKMLTNETRVVTAACDSHNVDRHIGNAIKGAFGTERFLHDNTMAIYASSMLIGFGVASRVSHLAVGFAKRWIYKRTKNKALAQASMNGFVQVGSTMKKVPKWKLRRYHAANHMNGGQALTNLGHLTPLSRDYFISSLLRRVLLTEATVDILTFITVYKTVLAVIGKEEFWKDDEGIVGNLLIPIGTGVAVRMFLPTFTGTILLFNRGKNLKIKEARLWLRDVIIAGSISGGVSLRTLVGKRAGIKVGSKASLKYGNLLLQRFGSRTGTGEQVLDDADEQELDLGLFLKIKDELKKYKEKDFFND